MTPESFRGQLDGLSGSLAVQIAHLLGLMPNKPSPRQWSSFIGALTPAVRSARNQASLTAQQFYASERLAHGITGESPIFLPEPYDEHILNAALTRVTRTRLNAGAGRGLIVAETTAMVARHVGDAAKQGIVNASYADPHAVGFARQLSGAENCAFCLMLASRGPVYKTARSAQFRTDGRTFHVRCDCIAVPVYDKSDWPGRADYLKYKRLWNDHASGDSDPLNAFRRYLADQQKADSTAQAA